MIGNFGDAEVFSFHATKFLNSLEGGAVTTNDDALAAKIRLMKNFGFAGYDKVIYLGTNGKMSEMAAAMGLTSLESLDEFVATNRRNYERYRALLEGTRGIKMLTYDPGQENNYQYVVVEFDEELVGIKRDQILQILWSENVIARRYFYPGCHRMEPYRSYYPYAGLVLPETNELVERVLQLPNGTAVGMEQIDTICQILNTALANGSQISSLLNEQGALGDHPLETELA